MPAAVRIDSIASNRFTQINNFGSSPAELFPSTSAFVANLPKGVSLATATNRDTVPKTAAEFAESLFYWLETSPDIRDPPAMFDAWQRYVRQVVQYATDHGLAGARTYHNQCMDTAVRGWWHPLAHGPSYPHALSQLTAATAAKPARAWNRSWSAPTDTPAAGAGKRKAPASPAEPPANRSRVGTCSLHPDASCYAHCLSFVFCFDFYVAMLLCSGRCVALADVSHFRNCGVNTGVREDC